MKKFQITCVFVTVLFGILQLPNSTEAQLWGNYNNQRWPFGRGPLPKLPVPPIVPSGRTIADNAQEYWISNKCIYPPRAFFAMFRDACDVKKNAGTFYSGICQAFFNSTKDICHLSEANEEDKQTMISLHELQSNVDNDDICDTLVVMRDTDPSLFPDGKGKDEWFSSTYNLLFSTDTCSSVCGLENAHPLCFGYMLNYNYIEAVKSKDVRAKSVDSTENSEEEETSSTPTTSSTETPSMEDDTAENEESEESEDISTENDEGTEKNLEEPITVDAFGSDAINLTIPYRPNPKILNTKPSDPAQYYYEFDDGSNFENEGAESEVISEVLENPELLNEMLGLEDDNLMGDKTVVDDDVDYQIDSNFDVNDLPKLTDGLIKEIEEVPVKTVQTISRPRLRGHVGGGLDRKEEIPLLASLLAFSGLLIVVSIFLLYKSRKKIGLYVRHMRQRRRNNWNYERVLTVQPDDDDYYE